MFPSRAQRHRRTTSKSRQTRDRRVSHPFGIETMEGRLMLATSALDYSPLDLEPAPFVATILFNDTASSDVAGQYAVTAGGTVPVPVILRYDLSFDTTTWNSVSGQEVADRVTAGQQVGLSSNVSLNAARNESKTDFYVIRQTFAPQGSILVGTDFSDYGSSALGGDGLQPVIFHDSHDDGSNLSEFGGSTKTGSLDTKVGMSSNSEGGPISIAAILTHEEFEFGPSPTRPQSIKSLAMQVGSEVNQRPALAATAASSAVSSEWARAMVLETAGGEPESAAKVTDDKSDSLTRKSAGRPIPETSGPLSFAEPNHSTGQRIAHAAAADASIPLTLVNWGAGAESNLFYATVPEEVAGQSVDSSDAMSLAERSLLTQGRRFMSSPIDAASAIPGAALEAAFHELGEGSCAESPSLASDWLNRSLGAVPLLMVLTLERIAASNSRRNRRDCGPVSVYQFKLARRAKNNQPA